MSISRTTMALVRIVQRHAGERNSAEQAEKLIREGADIMALTHFGSMILAVIAEEKRNRQTMPWKADNCLRLVKVLEKAACDQLSTEVFSKNGGDLQKMSFLIQLKANCYQSETYGPLGLLGSLLNQDKVPIHVDIVKFLIESDSNGKNALTTINDQEQCCLSLAKGNKQCPKDVIDYLQQRFDEIVNQIPFTQPQINPNQVIMWIRLGANVEATDKNGNTVLCNAASVNNLELVRALVLVGSNTTHKNRDGLTPLQIANKTVPRNRPLIAFLEGQRVNVQLAKLIETQKSTLTTEEVQTLLENGANINASMINGDTPLHILIVNQGTIDMVKSFVNDFNADLSATNTKGYRPLETCIVLSKESNSCLQTLIALPKMTTDKFHNPKLNKSLLQFATEQKRSNAAKLIQNELNIRLWNCIACLNINDDNNKTILDTATQLIAYGAQINHPHTDKEYDQWTVLHLATKISTDKVLRYMIKQLRADYMLQNGNGDYPISIAAQLGSLSMVEYLHDLPKLSLNVRNKELQTPLHLATKNNHLFVVRYLIKWGADDQAQDRLKKTPLDVAGENVFRSKEEEINNKKILQFLTQLVCPPTDATTKLTATSKKPTYDLDTCDLVIPVILNTINMNVDDADAAIGEKRRSLFSTSPNNNLHDAAKTGDITLAEKSIGEGADICYRRKNRTSLEVAFISQNKYAAKLKVRTLNALDFSRFQAMAAGCHQIIQLIQHIAFTKICDAIQQSNAGLVIAYHRAGAAITKDLLYKACSTSDNAEIIDYLVKQSADIYQAIINDTSPNSPYHIAKSKKFTRVVAYLKYLLSVECTKAVKENNLELVKKLVEAGANVELDSTNNLNEAIKHENSDLIEFLCQNGVKMPTSWLSAKTLELDSTTSQPMKPEIILVINRCLVERRLRFAAANGDLDEVVQCQHLGVNINSKNCHGSTALLCTIQHGNYFAIVHALVSRGASMLHSNENERASLIDLAAEQNYKQIAAYLSEQLNTQFLSAILNNDRQSAEKFAQLGADFNHKDEQHRTPLHYAVQYHGSELVTWLCECGSAPTVCDINGDYPITQATEKGDYAVVELFVTKYPATKRQMNKSGMTALQIAQKLKFHRIVQLIETGKRVPESQDGSATKSSGPKYDEETLIQAVRNGHIKIIREFIAERYESKENKKILCEKLIQTAERFLAYEILNDLKPYYEKLGTEPASDMYTGTSLVLTDHYRKILLGVLGSLNNLIAESSILLDPADPKTYTQFFVGLSENVAKRSQELQEVKNEKDVKKLIQKDEFDTKEQLSKIQEKLEELLDSRDKLQARVLDTDDRLFTEQKITALQRREFIKVKELHEQQVATYECSIFLFQRQQEAILNRQKALEFLKSNTNSILFYRTIENRLEALFHSCLAAQGGYVKIDSTKLGSTEKGFYMSMAKLPIINLGVAITKGILSPLLSKLDEKQQRKEWHNISTLGNIEELKRIASETAGLLTLYYHEQIISIDPLQRIKGSYVFNDKLQWLKQIYNVRPEGSEDMAVVLVAEYVTAWLIDGLKIGTEIIPTEAVPQQLWLHVVKRDHAGLARTNNVTDILGLSAGQQDIPVRVKNPLGKDIRKNLKLRYLIGCVSVVSNDGSIYQYPVPTDATDDELMDLENFGYVYVTPFSSDQKALQLIVEGRKLHLAKRDKNSQILTKFKDIIEHAKAYGLRNPQASKSLITRETASKVADVLREQKIFLDAKAVQNQLKAAEEKIELSVDVLREQIQEKASYYQLSIDAAHEQLTKESQTNREAMKKDNEIRYDQAMTRLNQQSDEIRRLLEKIVDERMNEIEQQLQEETKKIRAIAEEAKTQSGIALTQAREATETSHQAVENSAKAVKSAKNLTKWAEQRSEEFKLIMKNCEEKVRQTTLEQKQFSEKTISDIRSKAEQNMERSREAVSESARGTKESARVAKESQSTAQEIQKMLRTQQESHKAEIKKMITETKEIQQQNERTTLEAKEAQKQATRAADASSTTMEKVNTMHGKVEKALQKIQKYTKHLNSSSADSSF
ncbi:hypothetical protein I4U23_005091 [Adineta vaga]|nr:hypothetical protein I4U23_005091 [Adineta vaga]